MSEQQNSDHADLDADNQKVVDATRRKMLKKFGKAALLVAPAIVATTALSGTAHAGTRL